MDPIKTQPNKRGRGRPPKANQEPKATLTIKLPISKRDALVKWLETNGFKLNPWFRAIARKETKLDL